MFGTSHQQSVVGDDTVMECERTCYLFSPSSHRSTTRRSRPSVVALMVIVLAHQRALGSAAFVAVSHPWQRPAHKVGSRKPFGLYGKKHSRLAAFHHSSSDGVDGPSSRGDRNGKKEVKTKNSYNEWGIPSSRDLRPLHVPKLGSAIPKALPNGGRVTLVGSGPGDPDLLTVSAYRLLTENPDALVIADRLVSPEIMQLVAGEFKTARKLPGCADLAQEEIYWWVYQALAEGRHVIRLKIGDPFVFGRGGEEVLTFRRFGVEASVIPGVSAAFSAPLLGAIPVTHRGVSNQVVMCTGYGREGTSPDLIRYHKEQTIVFLMAVGRLRELCQRLQEQAGYPSDTPVAIVEKAGCPDQRTVTGNMRTIADIAEQHTIKPPSTIVVGDVVNVLIGKNDEGVPLTGLIQNFTLVEL